ncbi:GNAT family N-acetyltransferase [Aliidiomarina sedimenti]|uniref:GNAT family N-acetyltransferase n=1 Tax=Aliidiomarina sedimenti TaxID=1933879 RepID=A0ABY0C2R1_9GAMM|nr:GNAT family N-acetyltransferase [Aliidiomarina sedimenti]RUO31877.1 GNAT family N-acetyltransferase [Aliidiomarina sedimenti]
MQLVLPHANYEQSYRDYIAELGDEERYPFPLDFDHSDFAELLAKVERFRNGTDLPDGFVASTTYWLVDGDEIVGVANLRHYLNDRIRHAGGHIGLGIRPARRGHGLGSLLLKLTLEKAFERGINPVHIHCHKHNEASAKMILANGGVLQSELNENGEVVQRYVVATAP